MNQILNKMGLFSILFLVLMIFCTPSQLIQKLNQERRTDVNNDTHIEFNVIAQPTKDFVDSIVKIRGIDSTIDLFNNDAWYFLKIGDHGRAISRFNRILYLNKNDPNPYWGYGLILSSRCEIDSAIAFFEEAQKYDSNEIRLICDLAYHKAVKISSLKTDSQSLDDYNEIIEEYEKFKFDFQTYPILACQYAEILAEIGDSLGSHKQLQIAKENNYDIKNALKIIDHIKMGGTLFTYICKNKI